MAETPNNAPDEDDWQDASSSSSSDDDCEDLVPPSSILFSHEQPEVASPPRRTHAPIESLLYRARDKTTEVWLLADGNALKKRTSFPKLEQGYDAARDLYETLRHWARHLPKQLEHILGAKHPYLDRISVPFVPYYDCLLNHRPNPRGMAGSIVMQRIHPIRSSVVALAVSDILASVPLRLAARTIKANHALHPYVWMGMEQTAHIKDMLSTYPDMSQRPAYLDQILRYVGRRGALGFAREMGAALAVMHYDMRQDARGVRFRVGYDPEEDREVLWVCGLGRMGGLQMREDGGGFVGEPARCV